MIEFLHGYKRKLIIVFSIIGFLVILVCAKTVSKRMSSKTENKKPNHLIHEKSPYLLQHAYNPVDWYPWGKEALEKAKKENKPIFLSIGYSACHWCHVMEQESFEDPEVAKLMNDTFVCIKVDREERPDLDNIYMTVCQMMTGSGGWPLNVILTPDQKPFYAGTYIPRDNRYGRPGMVQLISQIQEVWKTRHGDAIQSANQINEILQQAAKENQGEEKLEESVLTNCYQFLSQRFDDHYGGFGGAPKFPSPHNFLFLLRYYKRSGNPEALHMVEKSLESMRLGGVYDQIGFGFHRYSTDSEWLVPHFEKMLYDQAMLARAYIETYQATGKEEFAQTAKEIFTYVLRDMTSSEGGFYSSEDADSEGEEGKFYLWTEDEVKQILGKEDGDFITRIYNMEKDGNFQVEATGAFNGSNILHLKKLLNLLAEDYKIPESELKKKLENAREKLFAVREKRIHPGKDDKILTDWNGLMIAAFAKGAQVFHDKSYSDAAEKAIDFILNHLRKSDGRLLHRYREGQSGLPAQVDDYSFLIWGLLEQYEATFDVKYLKLALELNHDFIEHYWDKKNGGFYFTADDGEELIVRQKEIYDGAIPSGNSVAILDLLRLGRITANPDFEKKSADITKAFSKSIKQQSPAHTFALCGLDFAFGPSYEVVIAGNSKNKETREMINAIYKHFIPNKVVILRPTEEESPVINQFAEFTKDQKEIHGKPTAYVCQNYACNQPTNDIHQMLNLLKIK